MRPDTLPPVIQGASAWLGPEASTKRHWQHALTDEDLRELESAATNCLQVSEDLTHIQRSNFLLPKLAPRLREIHTTLLHGCGFALIRSLPVRQWSTQLTAAAFYGLGTYLGQPRP
jgi:hypothetical protein